MKKRIVSGFAAMGMAAAIIVPLSYGAQGRETRAERAASRDVQPGRSINSPVASDFLDHGRRERPRHPLGAGRAQGAAG